MFSIANKSKQVPPQPITRTPAPPIGVPTCFFKGFEFPKLFFFILSAGVERYQVYQMEHLMHLVYLPRRILFQSDYLDKPKPPKPDKKRIAEHRAPDFFWRPM